MAVPAAHPAPEYSIRRAQAPKSDETAETGLDQPSPWAAAAWQVREDRAFYVPDVMSDRSYEADAELHRAGGTRRHDSYMAVVNDTRPHASARSFSSLYACSVYVKSV